MKKIWFVIIGILTGITVSNAQEESVIASAIYNFTRFVDWPDDGSTDFYIDIIGHKSVYDKLKELSVGKKVGTRLITVRYLESCNNITSCQILFVGFWQSKDMHVVLEKIGNAHTLIISEKDGLIDAGSGINFVIRNNTIKFEIKRSNVVNHGLSLSSQLEQIAYKTY